MISIGEQPESRSTDATLSSVEDDSLSEVCRAVCVTVVETSPLKVDDADSIDADEVDAGFNHACRWMPAIFNRSFESHNSALSRFYSKNTVKLNLHTEETNTREGMQKTTIAT